MDDEEIKRLHFQHQVWQAETQVAIDKATILPGHRMLDLGCGPGYLTLDLLVLKNLSNISIPKTSQIFIPSWQISVLIFQKTIPN